MDVEITPDPTPEERGAILEALAAAQARPSAYTSRWRDSALADLRDGALSEESRSDAGIVEP
jgi:hypothetical protein